MCTDNLVFLADNGGDLHVVCGGAEIIEPFIGENIESDDMNLGVTVLAGLGGGHFADSAGTALDDDETPLLQL